MDIPPAVTFGVRRIDEITENKSPELVEGSENTEVLNN